MPYVAPEKLPTRRDRLVQAITTIVVIGIAALVLQVMIDHTRQQAFRSLRDECDCLGCGS